MADEGKLNGGDQTIQISETEDSKGSKLLQKIDVLEKEKSELVRDNNAVREKISKVESEKAEVSKLKNDLIKAEGDLAKANKEADKLKESEIEKGKRLDVMEKERNLLLEKISKMEDGEKAKIGEKESEIQQLKKKAELSESVIEDIKKEKEKFKGEISELQRLLEKSAEDLKEIALNGIHIVEDQGKGIDGMKLQWPVLAASAGIVVTIGAIWYMRSRQR